MAFDELMRLMYQAAPYRWTVLGEEKDIISFPLEEAKYFYRTFYAPNNGVIIVVGDTTEAKLMSLVDKYYGAMKSQSVPHASIPEEPKQTKERRLTRTHHQATSEFLYVGYHVPSIMSPDIAPLSLLSTHLSVGMEARLRKLLVDTARGGGGSCRSGSAGYI